MRVYAALHEDIAEGFVWLKQDGLPQRCIVKITNTDNGRRVFCEALQFEKNFLDVYNKPSRKNITDPASSIVINQWYRSKLGTRGEPLETEKDHEFCIEPLDHWYNRWRGKLCACMGHPQVIVRVAVWLALLSVALGIISLVLGIRSELVGFFHRLGRTTTASGTAKIAPLSVGEVLGWRNTYGDLLGKPRDAVIERFGPPQTETGATLNWTKGPKTGNRSLTVFLDSASQDSSVSAVKIFAGASERPDVLDVLRKAPLFDFTTGTYEDSLLNYFAAATKDGRNTFQFDVTEDGLKFRGVLFSSK